MDNQKYKLENLVITEVGEFRDARGVLKVLQGPKVPFLVKRMFWISDVPELEVRGKHGHFETRQLLCPILGQVTLEVIPPYSRGPLKITLRDQEAFYLPPGHWVSMVFSSSSDILLVAADRDYDPTDVFLEPIK